MPDPHRVAVEPRTGNISAIVGDVEQRTRDDKFTDRGGPQWRQGTFGGLACLLAIWAGSSTQSAFDSWWLTLLVIVIVVGVLAIACRPLLSRR